MDIINLLPKHLKIIPLLDHLDLAKQLEEIKYKCYSEHLQIYDHLRKDIFQVEKSKKDICLNALCDLGKTVLEETVAYWSEQLENIIKETIGKIEDLFNIEVGGKASICLTVGNNTTNAIVTPLNGQTIFFFAEKLNSDYIKVLVSHELIHTIHRKNYMDANQIFLVDMLVMEGLACYYSKRLNPGFDNSEYTSFKTSENDQMRTAFIKAEAKAIYEDLYSESGDVFSKYLSSTHPYGSHYARLGYDIGLEVTEKFAETMSDQDILNLGLEDSRKLFEKTFEVLYMTNNNCFKFMNFDLLTDGEIDLVIEAKVPGNPEKGYVPAYKYKVCMHNSIERIGEIDIRVGSNQNTYYGGNIGYSIDEQFRGNSYASKACQLIKQVGLGHGMEQLIITCNPDNWPSRRTCEKIGICLKEIVDLPEDNEMFLEGEKQKCVYAWKI